MSTPNLRSYCGRCHRQQMSAMDLTRDPYRESSEIGIAESVQVTDPKDPGRVVRSKVTNYYTQKPALICNGCLEDEQNPIGNAPAIWVGGSKQS